MQATKLLTIAAVVAALAGGPTAMSIEATQTSDLTAVFKTDKGDIRVALFPIEAPLTVCLLYTSPRPRDRG